MILKGTAASSGRGRGRITRWGEPGESAASAALLSWDDAVSDAISSLSRAKQEALAKLGPEEASIFDAQIMIAEDPMLKEKAEELGGKKPGPAHAIGAAEALASVFDAIEDDYLRARGADIRQAGSLIAAAMEGKLDKGDGLQPLRGGTGAQGKSDRYVIAARDLTPSQTVRLDFSSVSGIALEEGAVNSHASILARALGIPCVVGIKGLMEAVQDGQPALLDAVAGELVIGDDLAGKPIGEEEAVDAVKAAGLNGFMTSDGHIVGAALNIGSAAEMRRALKMGFSGIDVGLMRTEFIYMGADELPQEEEQEKAYREIAALAAPGRVRFRTLDIGGDKRPPFIDIPDEQNPYLGLRSIRFSLSNPSIFKTQLRALASVACDFGIDVMFPMVTTADELDAAMDLLEEAVSEIEAEKGSMADIRAGIMVEVPSACLMADVLVERCSFFSLGTNDLVQYTMAADRGNPAVAKVYQQLNPAVLRLIGICSQACARKGMELSACGELAGTPEGAVLLAGLGAGKLSMAAGSVKAVAEALGARPFDEMKRAAEKALKARTQADVLRILKEM